MSTSKRTGSLAYVRYPLVEEPGKPSGSIRWPRRGLRRSWPTPVSPSIPEDPRYSALIGRRAIVPHVGREIPIVADDAVDPAFGTGAVKVTPGHDPTDFEIGQRQCCRSSW